MFNIFFLPRWGFFTRMERIFWPEWEGWNRDETYAFVCTGCRKTICCLTTQNRKLLFLRSLLRTSQALGLDRKVKARTFSKTCKSKREVRKSVSFSLSVNNSATFGWSVSRGLMGAKDEVTTKVSSSSNSSSSSEDPLYYKVLMRSVFL